MAGPSDDDRNRKNLESIREVLTRLETMAETNQKLAVAEDIELDEAVGSGLARGASGVVTSLSAHRKLDLAPGHRRQAELASPAPAKPVESKVQDAAPAPPNVNDLWKLSPSDLTPGNPIAADRKPVPLARKVRSYLALAGIAMLSCGLTLAAAFYWFPKPQVGRDMAQTKVESVPAAIVPQVAASSVIVPPVPVPAQRKQATPQIWFGNVIVAINQQPVAVPLRISAAMDDGGRDNYARIEGLPASATLNKGRVVEGGAWMLEAEDIAGLELTMPDTAPAETAVRLVLLARPDRVLAEGVGRIEYRAPQPKQTPPPVSAEVPESSQVLLRRGVELLAAGDAAAARKSLQAAAERGDPDAAFYLAMTFDPHFYARLGVNNLNPDIEQARHWYRVAAANGSADADKRLKELTK